MTSHRPALLVTAAVLLSLGLSACGGSGVTVGADGVSVQDGGGASVSVGPDGAVVADGNGTSVSAGADGAVVTAPDGTQVSAGADGTGVEVGDGDADAGDAAAAGSGGGSRQGTFGTTGQVTLTGALTWAGTASGTCDVNGDQRTVTATTADGSTIIIDANGASQVTLTVHDTGSTWTADLNGDGGQVVTLTSGRTLVSDAGLAGDGGRLTLDAGFDC